MGPECDRSQALFTSYGTHGVSQFLQSPTTACHSEAEAPHDSLQSSPDSERSGRGFYSG